MPGAGITLRTTTYKGDDSRTPPDWKSSKWIGENSERGPRAYSGSLDEDHALYGMSTFGLRGDKECVDPGGHDGFDFTLVSQGSYDRVVLMLPHVCQRWPGPIVVTVFDDDSLRKRNQPPRIPLPECPHADILVIKPPHIWPPKGMTKEDSYPVNHLRNRAISRVKTSHFLLVDIDLWPDGRLYHRLVSLSRHNPSYFSNVKQAIVIPAFNLFNSSRAVPDDAIELKQCIVDGECSVFDMDLNPDGHASTDYHYWFFKQTPEELKTIPCFDSNR